MYNHFQLEPKSFWIVLCIQKRQQVVKNAISLRLILFSRRLLHHTCFWKMGRFIHIASYAMENVNPIDTYRFIRNRYASEIQWNATRCLTCNAIQTCRCRTQYALLHVRWRSQCKLIWMFMRTCNATQHVRLPIQWKCRPDSYLANSMHMPMHANTYCPIRNANANAIWHAILHLQYKCQRTSILSVSFATIFYHLKDLFFFLNCVFVSLS